MHIAFVGQTKNCLDLKNKHKPIAISEATDNSCKWKSQTKGLFSKLALVAIRLYLLIMHMGPVA